MSEGLQVDPDCLEKVREILGKMIPSCEVRAFGSRVTGTAAKFSDLDLLIMTENPMDVGRLAILKEAFKESNLPFKVDVLDWAATGEKFRNLILEGSVLLQSGGVVKQGTPRSDI